MNNSHSINLASGQKLGGRYQILTQLGQGGFGRTFLAEDLYLPGCPKCVVKQLKPMATDPDTLQVARRLFDTEAQILHQLGTHPQIPQLFAYFEENQDFYLVQEYIEGENLAEELASHQTIAEKNVIDLLSEILEILAFVHQQKVIHRDVNPYNIIRRKDDGKLFLIDFGAVKQITTQMVYSPRTNYTIAIGTPGYFPSEQAIGSPKFSSDIYAVGIIGIQALTGRSPQDIPTNSQTGEINWHSLIRVSPGLTQVLNTMIRYDFRQRYPSAIEALEAIEKLKSYSSKTIAIPRKTSRLFRQDRLTNLKKWLFTGAFSLGLVGIGAGIFVGVNYFLASNNAIALYRQGDTFYNLKSYDRALQAYEKALKIRPEYAEAWIGKGNVQQASGKSKDALNSYEKAIQIQPRNWQAWIGRAQVLDKLGKSQEAIDTFKGAIQINNNAQEAWQGLAQIQMRLKQYPEAISSFDRLLKIESNNASAWYQKGWAWQNLRDYKQAIDAYDKAIEIKPDLSSGWYQKGNVLMNLQKEEEAVQAYEQAVQFQPKLDIAWYSLGIALSRLGRNEEALNAYSQATQARANNGEAWYQKGWTLHQLKRYDEAISAYETVIRLYPKNEQAWYNKGNVLYILKRYEDAIAAYQQTVALKKDYYRAWNSLGNALLQVKRYQEAINAYDRALRYQPDYKQAKEGKTQAEDLLARERQKFEENIQQELPENEERESGDIVDKIKRSLFN
ncbi:MAG: tetratricopeptide repeat protein [Hydrococcus sp. Prado102]|jgi:tetratricopeptide (TPR) repeat protein|nr:tetratricopeptide repeat protein [Hydrococcus sp. Prado102]